MTSVTYINKLYETHSQTLYFTSLRITGNSFEAEEIMHDTLLKFLSQPAANEIEKPAAWLKSVCIRKSLDKLRERHRTQAFLEEYREDPPATPPPPLQYTVEEIKGALLLLPDNYRTILSLHLFEGYDYQEIEQITGTKEATLRSLYKRAKEKLAAQLQQNRK